MCAAPVAHNQATVREFRIRSRGPGAANAARAFTTAAATSSESMTVVHEAGRRQLWPVPALAAPGAIEDVPQLA